MTDRRFRRGDVITAGWTVPEKAAFGSPFSMTHLGAVMGVSRTGEVRSWRTGTGKVERLKRGDHVELVPDVDAAVVEAFVHDDGRYRDYVIVYAGPGEEADAAAHLRGLAERWAETGEVASGADKPRAIRL